MLDKRYEFLRTEEKLGKHLMVLTLGGSKAYGTDVEGSDLDLRGVRLHTVEELLTMDYDKKPFEDKELDVVVYPVKKALSLLSSGSPALFEMFGTKEEHVLHLSEEGKLLRDNLDLFLTQRLAFSYAGFAKKKREEILHQAPSKKSFKCALHLLRTLAMGCEMLEGKGVQTYREHDRELLLEVRQGKYTFEEVFKMADELEERFKKAKAETKLPKEVDSQKVKELLKEFTKKSLEKGL